MKSNFFVKLECCIVLALFFVIALVSINRDSSTGKTKNVWKFSHHEKDSKYYVATHKVVELESKKTLSTHSWYGREGKWFSSVSHRKEGKIFGCSGTIDAELRRVIANGHIKKKDTLKSRAKDFLFKDRKSE